MVSNRSNMIFLVGAFRRKTQTIVVTFFSIFKGQRTDRFYKFCKLTDTITKLCHTTSLALGIEVTTFGSSPALDQKFFVQVCFSFVRLFSQFFRCLQTVYPSFFFYFAKEWLFKNSQRAPFTFFGTMRLTEDQKILKKFPKIWIFFSCFIKWVP